MYACVMLRDIRYDCVESKELVSKSNKTPFAFVCLVYLKVTLAAAAAAVAAAAGSIRLLSV